nr:MAG TPA: hypothetical protein [Caudoviricetes sp.]
MSVIGIDVTINAPCYLSWIDGKARLLHYVLVLFVDIYLYLLGIG